MEDLDKRIRKRRTETEEVIQFRLKKAKSELSSRKEYKYIVLNDIVDRAANEINSIIKENIAKQGE